jgi:hypothetical protein
MEDESVFFNDLENKQSQGREISIVQDLERERFESCFVFRPIVLAREDEIY